MNKLKAKKMKQLTTICIFLLFLIGCACFKTNIWSAGQHNITRERFINNVNNSVVTLVKEDGDSLRPYCAGVWIGKNIILTAFHCAESGAKTVTEEFMSELFGVGLDEEALIGRTVEFVTYRDLSNKHKSLETDITISHTAKLVAGTRETDLALLITTESYDQANYHIADMTVLPPKPGMHTVIVGHSSGMLYTYSEGVVAGIRILETVKGNTPTKVIQISGEVWFGNSGGGAFDNSGNLLGICSFLIPSTGGHISFFIHRDVIKDFLYETMNKGIIDQI